MAVSPRTLAPRSVGRHGDIASLTPSERVLSKVVGLPLGTLAKGELAISGLSLTFFLRSEGAQGRGEWQVQGRGGQATPRVFGGSFLLGLGDRPHPFSIGFLLGSALSARDIISIDWKDVRERVEL